MSTVVHSEECTRLLSSHSGPILIGSIAKRLRSEYGASIEDAELVGWASLGVIRASEQYDPERLQGITADPERRLCEYIITCGYNRAVDEMRHAGIVGRKRYGVFSGGPVSATNLSDLSSGSELVSSFDNDRRGGGTPVDFASKGYVDPAEEAANRELINEVLARLTGHEKSIFTMRYQEGMELRAIADLLNITTTHVYQLHLRLLQKIREFVEGNRDAFCPNKRGAVAVQ